MDGNRPTSGLQRCEVRSMREKEAVLSVNGELALFTNGYSSKAADDGSGSECGYATPKKRRAKRNGVKDSETLSKACSKQDAQTSSQELPGKVASSRPNGTRTCLKADGHPGSQDMTPVGNAPCRNSDCKPSGLVGKKTDDKISKAKLIFSVTSKEDSWTLFKPPPVFPVDNSSAKIVPKISYASKVKENLNKATAQASVDVTQTPVKLSQVPMSAVKTVTSVSLANSSLPLEANGFPFVGTLLASAASTAPSAMANLAEENVASILDVSSSSSSDLEPRKSSLFVYPHKPLNMQPAPPLGDIFQNQWGLSFINEPSAGPDGAVVSRTGAVFHITDLTFQGEGAPFVSQTNLDSTSAVSLPEPLTVKRRTSGPDAALNLCSAYHTASEDCPQPQYADLEQKGSTRPEFTCEESDAEPAVNKLFGAAKTQSYSKAQDSQGWTDMRAAVLYHTKEFERILTRREQDPNTVVYFTEAME